VIVAGMVLPQFPDDGLIAVISGTACVTVKAFGKVALPTPVVTDTDLEPGVAVASMTTVTGRLVAVPPVPMLAETPIPPKVTAVAPARFVPLMVAGTVAPGAPEDGVIPEIVSTGGAGGVTVKPVNGADVPAPVVTVNVRVSVVAPVAMATITGRLVAVPPLAMVAVIPVPLKVTAVAPFRFVPLMVAGKVAPGAPEDGVMPEIVSAGAADDVTVKPVKGADVPAPVVTVNVRVLVVTPVAMAIINGRLVDVPSPAITAVIPVPLKVTAVAPLRSVPAMVAARFVPTVPEDGVMPVIVGTGDGAAVASRAMLWKPPAAIAITPLPGPRPLT